MVMVTHETIQTKNKRERTWRQKYDAEEINWNRFEMDVDRQWFKANTERNEMIRER